MDRPRRAGGENTDIPPWPELDVLRGLAAIAMVGNHAVASWIAPTVERTWLAEALFLVGGFAPILFFFATGFGSGLQSLRSGRGEHRYGFARKLAILTLADQFMFWRWGKDPAFGIDFLTFIAISTAAVEPLRRMRRATLVALAAAALVLLGRFGLAPLLSGDPSSDPGVLWLLRAGGRLATPGVAYPPLPWLAVPLVGFALGRELGAQRGRITARPVRAISIAASVALLGASACLALEARGFDVNRYGVMSAGYLPLVFAAVGAFAAVAFAIARHPALARAVELRGVASLAVVPLHFALLYELAPALRPAPGDLALATAVALSALACVGVSKAFARGLELALARTSHASRAVGTGFLAAWVVFAIAVMLVPIETSSHARNQIAAGAQLALCAMLVLPGARRA